MNGRNVREKWRQAGDAGGFTLAETLVALCLGFLVLTGLVSLFRTHSGALQSLEQEVEMRQNLRAAMAVMTGEIRMAGFNPLRMLPLGIMAAGGDSITFQLDRGSDRDGVDNDGNGVWDGGDPGERNIPNGTSVDPNEYITYSLRGRDRGVVLVRRSTRNGRFQPLAECVESLRFFYYGAASNTPLPVPVADPGDIRSVGILLTGRTKEPDPATGRPRTFTLESRVCPWNLQ